MKFKLSQFSAIKGDGQADDTLPFLDACRQMPDGSTCEWDVKMRWTDTVPLTNRARLRFWNAHDPRDVTPQEIEYGAFYDGPAGHDMFVHERCRRVSLEGISLAGVPHNETTGGAGRILYLDQHAGTGNQTSTRATLTRCCLWMGFRNGGDAFANSLAAVGNCDYPTLKEVMIVGGGGKAGMVRWYGRWNGQVDGVSVDGDVATAAKAGTFRPSDAVTQERFVIANAAGSFESRIIGVISDTQAKLATSSPTVFDHAYATIGEAFGTGVHNGPNFNDKRLRLDDVEIYGCKYGVHSEGGSMGLRDCVLFQNEVNVFVEGSQADPSWEFGTDTEASRHHLVNMSGKPYWIAASRFAPIGIAPGGSYFDFTALGGGGFGISYSTVDEGSPVAGSRLFGLDRSSRHVISQHNAYPSNWTRADLGWMPEQLGKGTLIETDGDSMQGGPAQTAPYELIGNFMPNARPRLSGRAGWIHGTGFNPVRAAELQPGEWAVQKLYATAKQRRGQRIYRDYDGTLWTENFQLGKAEKED